MSNARCAWCPWDCPSPETAACRQDSRPVPEVIAGVCEPTWRNRGKLVPRRKTVDVIRDLADYEAATNS